MRARRRGGERDVPAEQTGQAERAREAARTQDETARGSSWGRSRPPRRPLGPPWRPSRASAPPWMPCDPAAPAGLPHGGRPGRASRCERPCAARLPGAVLLPRQGHGVGEGRRARHRRPGLSGGGQPFGWTRRQFPYKRAVFRLGDTWRYLPSVASGFGAYDDGMCGNFPRPSFVFTIPGHDVQP
ncbi:hypothetical protein STTU_3857 [Streptomyces sp. Tu6071]|nr:hypothetical protein STTU_3857 [Streptomyces sp. Tu6071]